ncbi:AraC family transcriptional regulator [Neptunomonas antarctica]|uniref:Transcriptional regulator, AraC family n=1 Tax=Neptunomonas antarctica TaxID=619304 RepID=A0A1N7L205_9GAMM|nr:AraC family transcriptional regulator [Neptunomonas antarctica]SIS67892.1 transcriptional regulator, AraC family [Neptunomonas antarctica]
MKQRIQPEFEWVDQQADASIRYLEHGYPSPLVRWHYHDEYELHLITATTGKVFIGDYIGNFSPGSLILVGPQLPHNWVSQIGRDEQIDLRDRVVNFSPEFVRGCESVFQEMRVLAPFWERASYGIEFLDTDKIQQIVPLFEEIATSSGLKRLTRFLTLIELLASISDYRVLSSSAYVPIQDSKILHRLNLVINYIFEHYDSEITLDEIAKHVDMSPTYFSKFFKKSTGQRFVEFVNGMRINKACEHLAHTDEPITDICFTVGFNNIANFNRRFFALKEMTPSEYRKTSIGALYIG